MEILLGIALIAFVSWFFLFRKRDTEYPENVSGGGGWRGWIKRFDPRRRG